MLRNIALKALHDLGTGGLIGPDDLTVVFRIKLVERAVEPTIARTSP